MNNGKFFAGLALGALVGSALSCFAHSNRGRKLRRDVYDAIQDLQEDAKDLAHHAKHKAEQVSSEVAGKVGEKVEEDNTLRILSDASQIVTCVDYVPYSTEKIRKLPM